ncbi:GTPase HflX [Roseibacillus persicicus]|uniref:GTPase HflX n=1 Tax=Roseibacillus persicicus TaxID=454148 RepID=A0A918THD9_9BACT|nr:GTPase HflX [Roseibacillus persicicus]MDQ8190883.1 GTPase HflX [Roseibacillus persicicus]GHC45324.1 GTPase HflX [Roseibacillus persicicus]
MFEVREKPDQVERALLVGFYFKSDEEAEARALLLELEELVDTLGIGVVGMELIRVRAQHKAFICGTGKSDEVVELAREKNCDCLIVDNGLSPSQQRNWEGKAGITVIDREEVILDIFAKRASTKEAQLQVQLARMEYALPRMAKMWGHLDREGGGGGGGGGGASRGMGEQQIEIDRRLARNKITQIKKDLEIVRRQRATRRKDRDRYDVASSAIVGYTNAGKSTLLNKLSGSEVYEADQLFATLDPTTRRIELPGGQPLLLTDTVGFVRNLPHRLVEAFKSTLEEAVLADFLIHVLDASDPAVEVFYRTTLGVLEELGAGDKPALTVLNKVDRLGVGAELTRLRESFPDAIEISARTGFGMEELIKAAEGQLADRVRRRIYRVPQSRGDMVNLLHNEGKVINTDFEGNDVIVTAVVSPTLDGRLKEFLEEKAG